MKLVIFCFVGLALMAFREGERRSSAHSSASLDDSLSDNCKDHFRFDRGPFSTVMEGEEIRMVPGQAWKIFQQQGGVTITTWDRSEFSVKLCKLIAVNDQAQGRRLLGETKIAVDASTISVDA